MRAGASLHRSRVADREPRTSALSQLKPKDPVMLSTLQFRELVPGLFLDNGRSPNARAFLANNAWSKHASPRTAAPPFSRRVLITGCGRSGTKYASFVLQRLGLEVPHERLGRDGISSWTMAVETESRPYGPPSSAVSFQNTFHQVREPLATIASCLTFNDESWDFICRHVECPRLAPVLVRAATYWLLWNEKAEEIATWRYRIEDFDDAAPEICNRLSISFHRDAVISIPRNFNTRREGRAVHIFEELFRRGGFNVPAALRARVAKPVRRECVTWGSLQKADPVLCARVREKAVEYGYRANESETERSEVIADLSTEDV
jgi:hypothetical protein